MANSLIASYTRFRSFAIGIANISGYVLQLGRGLGAYAGIHFTRTSLRDVVLKGQVQLSEAMSR